MPAKEWQNRIDRWRGKSSIEFDLEKYVPHLEAIERAEWGLKALNDRALKEQAARFSIEIRDVGQPADFAIDVFALVREAAHRVVGMRPFDVQVMAGLAMLRGRLVEMKTGEGKTLAAVLPATLLGMTGKGVHILTFNDYLAERDAVWMGPIYSFLGLSVGAVREGQTTAQRKEAYAADVTYATAKEAGFDFLRMHLCRHPDEIVHRPFHFVIVDEADSLLIDEARVPLVIAGPRSQPAADPYRIAAIVRDLEENIHWERDEHARNVQLTENGIEWLEAMLHCGDLHDEANYTLLTEINQALHARALLHRDVDYIVRDGRVELVDEFTGRVVDDRRWPDGLQAAIEAKEGLLLQPGGRILGSITLQHYLKQYPRMAGMTATAQQSAEEIFATYGLHTTPIPTNKPCLREDLAPVIFTHKAARDAALVREAARNHRLGRPVLVGTASIRESDRIADMLERAGVPCRVLNAKNDRIEAKIVAEAGAPGAVTISTNMAGRGTDIKLGGANELLRDEVMGRGGLYVIGTTMHESRRIDDQLRGRAGRQGDPGTSVFFVSLEDDLIRRFGIAELIPKRLWPENQENPLDHPMIRREANRIQRIVEGQNHEIRNTLQRYSEVVERQRAAFQSWRMEVLLGPPVTMMCRREPDRYRALARYFGEAALDAAERGLLLQHIDERWADHLAFASELREGIHLVGIGGLNPLHEFNKTLVGAFQDVQATIEDRVQAVFKDIRLVPGGLNPERLQLRAPSATWTYLVNDRVLSDLQNSLFGQGSAGFAAIAVLMTWPLLLIWGMWQRRKIKSG